MQNFYEMITERLIEEHWPLTNVRIENVLQERHGRVVREIISNQGKYIYKIAHPIKGADALAKDTAVFDLLSKQRFSHIPRLLKTKDDKDFVEVKDKFVYILEFIEGENPEANPITYTKLGEITALLHSVQNYPYKTDFKTSGVVPDLLKNSVDYSFGVEYRKILEKFPDFDSLPQTLIHTDINPGNALEQTNGNIILIDWDDAGIGTRILDLGVMAINHFVSEDLEYNKENAEAFFNAYLSKQNLNSEEIEHIFDAGLFFACMYIPYGAGLEKRWTRIQWAINNRELLESVYRK